MRVRMEIRCGPSHLKHNVDKWSNAVKTSRCEALSTISLPAPSGQGCLRASRAEENEILFWSKPLDWKNQTLTRTRTRRTRSSRP
jgi:hypothetical protein